MIVDFHSHILPGIDDGSQTVEESAEMLQVMEQQGVECVIATPHFYPNRTSLQRFLEKRNQAYEKMISAGLPGKVSIKLGAEVAYFDGIGRAEQLDCLCIEGTKLLLLEMPLRNWTVREIAEIRNVIDNGIIPILAHVERYYPVQRNKSVFREIAELPVYFQISPKAFTAFRTRRITAKIIACNPMILLGSDCHNLQERAPDLPVGREALQKKYGEDLLRDMDALGEKLLSAKA